MNNKMILLILILLIGCSEEIKDSALNSDASPTITLIKTPKIMEKDKPFVQDLFEDNRISSPKNISTELSQYQTNVEEKKVLVCLMDWEGELYPLEKLESTLEDTTNFYKENSYGKVKLTFEISIGSYSWSGPKPVQAADMVGPVKSACTTTIDGKKVQLTAYDGLIILPGYGTQVSTGTFLAIPTEHIPAGFGLVDISSNIYGILARAIKHELGHALFRLDHASALDCGNVVYLNESVGYVVRQSQNCKHEIYGNPFDIMGEGNGHFSAIGKEFLGWIKSDIVVKDGTYLLSALEIESDYSQILKIPLDRNVCIEYRKPIGYDADSFLPLQGGLLLTLCNEWEPEFTRFIPGSLLDLTPNSKDNFKDAFLINDTLFEDDLLGISLSFRESGIPNVVEVMVNIDEDKIRK